MLASGEVDTIMLDNFSRTSSAPASSMVAGRAIVEASGGITLDTIADVAATGSTSSASARSRTASARSTSRSTSAVTR